MLMQSPPMHAAGKSHSSMSAGDQRGGESQALTPLRQPEAAKASPRALGCAHTPGPLLDLGGGWTGECPAWSLRSGSPGVGRNGLTASSRARLPSHRLRSLDRW